MSKQVAAVSKFIIITTVATCVSRHYIWQLESLSLFNFIRANAFIVTLDEAYIGSKRKMKELFWSQANALAGRCDTIGEPFRFDC